MFLGRVVGSVWSTVKWPQAVGLKLLLVRPYCLADLAPGQGAEPTDDLVVCADRLDAGPGDDVIVAFGNAARLALSEGPGAGAAASAAADGASAPIDAAVVAIVDRVELHREPR